jgi:hypothetical protein
MSKEEKRVRVLYAYDAAHDDELTIQPGMFSYIVIV